ncbi:MAG: hypothetical protein AVDCRST_MAG87-3436 [uncultured Thermomicrobiales bacterium]|uniref:Uncharacterized protein n=1 Tax=uncultured Thermomicrobiales bacterium TaxID=1645740 RepID=A0A6J4VLI7_9BACT|nr:MAG: hypothetical protein AVDCRST_MAG87-3436 [uncultured Thermomicrobiales bacterium]
MLIDQETTVAPISLNRPISSGVRYRRLIEIAG